MHNAPSTETMRQIRTVKPTPRDSPMRELAEAFLREPQMQWLTKVTSPIPFEEWVRRYPTARQEQLTAARDAVRRSGLEPKHALVKNFL